MAFPPIFGPTSGDDLIGNPVDDLLNRNKGQNIGQPGVKFTKGALTYVDDLGTSMDFQFNPSQIKEKLKANWAVKKPIQSEQPVYQHLNFDGRCITFELFLHGLEPPNGRSFSSGAPEASGIVGAVLKRAEEGLIAFAAKRVPFAEGVGTAAGILFNKAFPPNRHQVRKDCRDLLSDFAFLRKCLHGQGNKPPPRLFFEWPGYDESEWILEDYNIDVTMWSTDLIPLMAKIPVTLCEVKPPKFGGGAFGVTG